jgi:PI31 proteasome regulator N-terminal
MAKITLEPSSILRYIPMVLPQGSTVASAPEALAVLIHAVNQALGLQLLGVSENENENVSEDGSLPTSWNARSPDFNLKYREPGSAQTIVVKIMKLGNKTQIHGLLEQARTAITIFLSINQPFMCTYRKNKLPQPTLLPQNLFRLHSFNRNKLPRSHSCMDMSPLIG